MDNNEVLRNPSVRGRLMPEGRWPYKYPDRPPLSDRVSPTGAENSFPPPLSHRSARSDSGAVFDGSLPSPIRLVQVGNPPSTYHGLRLRFFFREEMVGFPPCIN